MKKAPRPFYGLPPLAAVAHALASARTQSDRYPSSACRGERGCFFAPQFEQHSTASSIAGSSLMLAGLPICVEPWPVFVFHVFESLHSRCTHQKRCPQAGSFLTVQVGSDCSLHGSKNRDTEQETDRKHHETGGAAHLGYPGERQHFVALEKLPHTKLRISDVALRRVEEELRSTPARFSCNHSRADENRTFERLLVMVTTCPTVAVECSRLFRRNPYDISKSETQSQRHATMQHTGCSYLSAQSRPSGWT